MSLSWICKYVINLYKEGKIGVERDEDKRTEWHFLCLNANRTSSPDNAREDIAAELGCKKDSIEQKLTSTGLILVVDEIDGMLRSSDWRRLLSNLLVCANNKNSRFAIIGISNSLMDEKYAQIYDTGRVSPHEFPKGLTTLSWSSHQFLLSSEKL